MAFKLLRRDVCFPRFTAKRIKDVKQIPDIIKKELSKDNLIQSSNGDKLNIFLKKVNVNDDKIVAYVRLEKNRNVYYYRCPDVYGVRKKEISNGEI